MVDFLQTDPKILDRYLGKDGARQLTAYHGTLKRERFATCV